MSNNKTVAARVSAPINELIDDAEALRQSVDELGALAIVVAARTLIALESIAHSLVVLSNSPVMGNPQS